MKIFCIGRNYVEHAHELKNEVPGKPIFFMKPDTALLLNNNPFYLPDFSSNVHYEVELVYKISRVGKNIDVKFAHRYFKEIALGIDFTARDLQDAAKSKGLPWEIAKAFDNSAVLSQFVPFEQLKAPSNIEFTLEKNGKVVQHGFSEHMIFQIDHLIAYLSRFFTLKIGDLIYSGTPAGVGPVNIGDQLCGKLENQEMFNFRIL
jgi:acylpyruvate hydrolase